MRTSLKWAAGVAVLVLLLGVAWWSSQEDAVPVAPVAVTATVSPPPPPPERDESGQPPSPPPTPQLEAVVPPSQPVAPEAIVQETALLDRARREAKTEPQTALKSLTEYRQAFPQGQLHLQAEVVRLEALLRLGKRAEGENLARKLIGRDPRLKQQVEHLLKDARPL